MNFKLITKYCFFFLIYSISAVAQNNNDKQYFRYLDSANNKIDNFPELANTFLDSIPEALDKNIKGRIAEYYNLKAVISSHLSKQAEVYHYNILALKYAEKEKNYNIAGTSSLELFYNIYIINKDSTAFDYLKKAEKFYALDNNEDGLTEVMQMEAFVEFYQNNYEKSNALILSKLDHYQSIKDDQYYYMYALFMLTSNYSHLNDVENLRKYFKAFKNLKTNSTIAPLLYNEHEVTLYNCMAEMYLGQKALDSTLTYLQKASSLRQYMNDSDIENYFKYHIAYNDASQNLEIKSNYVDSLKVFQENMIRKTVDASFNINETLFETTQNLEIETKKKYLNRNWIIALGTILLAFFVFVLVRYNNIKNTLKAFFKQKQEYTLLQSNHEKLKVKVKGIEGYLAEVKKEMKMISTINNIKEQQHKIKELYKNIHHNSSTLLSKSEDHLELISDLNVDFFSQISTKHPDLNPSETIVCYYLFMGFKSKEIGAFINTSTRAVESKRYRITNKLNLKEKGYNLADYLIKSFNALEIN